MSERVPAGAFAASRTRMEEMLAHLSDLVMTACTQEVPEDCVVRVALGRVRLDRSAGVIATVFRS
ncbi:hypothetical protein [Streptomyces sp. NPDC053427]|uniref:hypothetical protein n=1 Tax=Streptomyces sp. NPDC053427 TaxID=3365701 RepID=UPI0037CD45E4